MEKTYYFTYGIDAGGGWTEVVADGYDAAVEAFCFYHPRKEGFVDCAEIYDAEDFRATKMATRGNFGKCCVEKIRLVRGEVAGT